MSEPTVNPASEGLMVTSNQADERGRSTGARDRRVILSAIWIFATFNYIYADILTLYFGSALQPAAWHLLLATGQVGSVHASQGVILVGGIVLETAIAMTLLARVLPYQLNRWANIVVAVIQTVSVAATLRTALYANLFYWFFAVIEIGTTLFVIWYAWTWRRPRE